MPFDTSIFQQRPTQISGTNALMQALQINGEQQKNALMGLQMQDVHDQRRLAIQKAQEEAARRQNQNALYQGVQAGQKLDPAAALAAGLSREDIAFLANSGTLGMPKVARTIERAGPGGMPETVSVDEFNRPVGDAFAKPVEQKLADLGGRMQPYNPYTIGAPMAKTMTPGEVASNGLGYARLAQDRAQADARLGQERMGVEYRDDGNGNVVAVPKYAVPGALIKAGAVTAPGPGMVPLGGKGANMTEDQGKATGWLIQAENAFKNMRAATNPNTGTPSAAKPGFPDVVAGIPSMGIGEALGNTMRSADRQKFMQGASSLSESLLRAATGAGVNKDEAVQKIRELTPVFGESAETTAQKMAAIPLYIESLKVRAGPGAKKAAGVLTGGSAPSAVDMSDPLGLRGK